MFSGADNSGRGDPLPHPTPSPAFDRARGAGAQTLVSLNFSAVVVPLLFCIILLFFCCLLRILLADVVLLNIYLTTLKILIPHFDNSAFGVIISWSGRVSNLFVVGGSGRVTEKWTHQHICLSSKEVSK